MFGIQPHLKIGINNTGLPAPVKTWAWNCLFWGDLTTTLQLKLDYLRSKISYWKREHIILKHTRRRQSRACEWKRDQQKTPYPAREIFRHVGTIEHCQDLWPHTPFWDIWGHFSLFVPSQSPGVRSLHIFYIFVLQNLRAKMGVEITIKL